MKAKPIENENKQITSSGERSVMVGGDVSHSTINTGDIYNVYNQENQIGPVIRNILESKIENLSSELSKEIAVKLEDLREMSRVGMLSKAFEEVEILRKSSNWDAFEPPLRASILRTLAIMTLGTRGKKGLQEAKLLAAEAKQTDAT